MLLRAALEEGWTPMDFEQWIVGGGAQGRVLILRHDVDQYAATALKMARIEEAYGLASTWYFRWRTASPRVISRIQGMGGAVGLHYETLTRLVRDRDLSPAQIDDAVTAEAREELAREVLGFAHRFGPINSICAHGDTRVPGVSNQVLLRGVDAWRFGVHFDAGQALSRHRLGLWMTDRTATEGRWKDGIDPLVELRESEGPILCLTHPNNWCLGAALWFDRARAATGGLTRARGDRNARDRPPSIPVGVGAAQVVAAPDLRAAPPVRSFAPVAVSLRREILRHYYDGGKHVTTDGSLRTLDTNSSLAESRAGTLEHALAHAGVRTVRDRDVVDLGCGFGALALVFASRGARVTALDPNEPRLRVGERVGEEYHLGVSWHVGGMDAIDLGEERFDVAVMNNSFCYVVDPAKRRAALDRVLRALRPGAVLVLREPKRLRVRDQFTGIPLLGLVPPRLATGVSRILRLGRSDVRLLWGHAAKRELRVAGFVEVEITPTTGHRFFPTALSGYQHLVARRPRE